MPDPLYLRLQRLAALTQRPVESLVLQALEAQNVAQGAWSLEQHVQYTALLDKERASTLTPSEKATLEALYHEANCYMLRKAYANALLKWRGHPLPTLAALEAAP